MTERQSFRNFLDHAEQVIAFAKEQNDLYNRQEPQVDAATYTNAQQQLENAYIDLQKLEQSSNSQQREEIQRVMRQLLELQNDMIIDE